MNALSRPWSVKTNMFYCNFVPDNTVEYSFLTIQGGKASNIYSVNIFRFRVVLRCRQLARERFAKLRSDVLVKLELLDNKHGRYLYL